MERDKIDACASCGSDLEARGNRLVCAQCNGTLVGNDTVMAMIRELAPDDDRPLAQRFGKPHDGTPRPCPRCAAMMKTVSLNSVPLDQCGEHGIWFDVSELVKVLEANGAAYTERAGSNARTNVAIDFLIDGPIGAFINWAFESKRTPK